VIVSFGDQTNVVVLAAAAGLGVPVVVSERTSPDHHEIGRWWRFLRRRAYPRAARVVVQTARTAEAVRAWAGTGIVVLPNPVSPVATIAGRDDAREIVSIGRLVPSKAFDVLLRAFSLALPSLPEWRLTIVGDGPERRSLERLAVELGVADRVTFTGYVPAPEAVLQRAGVFVTTTRYEGFPNALAEAMASGLPVIATDCPTGPRELTLDGSAGVLVPVDAVDAVAAALRRLCGDAAERARLGAAARAAMQPFEASRVVAQWQRLLLDVVDEAGV
jgi:GalNAc-alpha-(1->4)-GalNAc-alpha-(1->3)-diNAcBac-PP-undecaprenol alpha-1,4-N-acetyl-D-galactosaminyltransferase